MQDLKDVLSHLIYKDGNDNIRDNFERLPDKARKALLQTVFRDLQSSEKIIHEIQDSIEIYALLANKLEGITDTKEL